jgi:TonB family protein
MTWLELFERCAWAATIVLTAAFLAGRLLRRAPAAWRHFLWTAALAGLLVLPAMVRGLPRWNFETVPSAAAADAVTVTQSTPARAAAPPRAWNPVLLAWLAGCVLAAGRLAMGRLRIAWMVRHAARASWAQEAMNAAGGHGVRVLESAAAPTALAVGIWRPLVVLPAGAGAWPAARLRAALLHELMHVRRRDLAAQGIAQAACCLYWFLPLAWLAARQQRREREQACDDAVLGRGMTAHDYAGHLVDSVRALRGRRSGAMAMAEPSLLELRVRALLDAGRDRRPLNRRAALAMVAVLALVLLPLAAVTVHAQAAPAHPSEPVSAPAADPPEPQADAAGALSGTVEDPSGARVPGCAVKALNLDDSSREAVTTAGAAGEFRFASLPAGHYSLEVRAAGFKPFAVKAAVPPNGSPVVNARLTLGDISEVVTVSAARASTARAAEAPSGPARIRVGGMVQPSKLVYKVPPVYPEELKAKGVTGTVRLVGIVTKQGLLDGLHVVNTDVDPGLAAAALEAASHWMYQPSLLNGEPVAVLTNIDITFELH